MKKPIIIAALAVLVVSALLTQPGCSRESRPPDFSGNTTGTINIDYVKSYNNIKELAADANLIVVGMIDRTIEVVPDEATKSEDPKNRTYLTRSAFRVERVLKGDAKGGIIISQMGAIGWAEEYSNPIFQPGERYFLFLRASPNGIYYLLNPLGRYKITDGNVYSMNYILPTGQSRPPLDLMFWKIDLQEFIGKVDKEIQALD